MIYLRIGGNMTREKLQALSEEVLRSIAQREGIYNYTDAGKEELVELILDALEENRSEQESNNNAAIRLERKKYEILIDEEVNLPEYEEYSLPERYNDTRIVILLKDPMWAYAYWDINSPQSGNLKEEPFFEGFFLRVYEFHGEVLDKSNIVDVFDIPVGDQDKSWYINLNSTGIDYCVELRCKVMHQDRLLAVSNPIHSPLGYFARNQEEFFNEPDTMMLMLSGLWDYEEGETRREEIPQRIISILDSHNIEI